ncbi:MAG: serine hydrolase domain-containing protein [Anaerolineae bacterium]
MTNFEEAFKRLDQFIEQKMKVTNVPGMAVAVTDREKLLRVSTYGFADVAAQTPVTPEMLFEIGSIGKSFTSIALLQLWEEGRLDLHEPVTRYLPWFEVQSEYEPITPHHLMSHTAGITMGPEFPGEARYEVWALRETEATAPPGTYYHYSDAGYKTLGVVLESLLGQPYGDIIQARILDPLGMTATEPIITNETRKRLAVGYEAFYDDRPLPRGRPLAPATWLEHAEGAGSIASTPADMATYLRTLMNRGQGPRGRILSEESFDLMTQRIIEAKEEGEGSFYGYGLGIRESDGHTTISHGGGMVGYYSYMLADMDDGLGIIVLMNGPGGQSDEEIANLALKLLRAALHDQELLPVPPTDPTKVENGTDYAGTYRACSACPERSRGKHGRKASVQSFTLLTEGKRLILHYGDERVVLERRDPDRFYVDHPDFALFLLHFERKKGEVVEAFHGPDWYTNERYAGPTTFDHPEEWDAYPGHYCSHNPWLTNFRVVLRKGALALIHPSGDEEPLMPLGDGVFRVGEDERSPERIRFAPIINGQALRANLSCGEYYRTFTR